MRALSQRGITVRVQALEVPLEQGNALTRGPLVAPVTVTSTPNATHSVSLSLYLLLLRLLSLKPHHKPFQRFQQLSSSADTS